MLKTSGSGPDVETLHWVSRYGCASGPFESGVIRTASASRSGDPGTIDQSSDQSAGSRDWTGRRPAFVQAALPGGGGPVSSATCDLMDFPLGSFGLERRFSLQTVGRTPEVSETPGRIRERIAGRFGGYIEGRPMTRPSRRWRISRSETMPGERIDTPTRYAIRTLSRSHSIASMFRFTSYTTRRDRRLCRHLYEHGVLIVHPVSNCFKVMGSLISSTSWATDSRSLGQRQ
jgi:hypothetical protein